MAKTGTYALIASNTLTNTNTLTFSSIPQTFTDLIIVGSFGMATAGDIAYVRVGNGSVDTANNYSQTKLEGNGSAASSARVSNTGAGFVLYSGVSNNWCNATLHFQDYSNTSTYKTWLSRQNDSTTLVGAYAQLWRSTSAINIITIYTATGNNFTNGSTFKLYGIQAYNGAV